MILSINNKVSEPRPLFSGQKIIIAIDSSKSNTGIAFADEYGNELSYIELNGETDGTEQEDTLRLCKAEREALKIILQGSEPVIVGIENIITKKSKSGRTGMTEHMSRFKITAVFMSFISFFQDNYNITPELINNWTWKSHILPAEFRTEDIGKGSLAYFKSIHSKYQYCSDDVTDAVCILRYLCMIHKIKNVRKIDGPEACKFKYNICIVNKTFKFDCSDEVEFIFNEELTLDQNVKVMSNYISNKRGVIACSIVPTKWFNLTDIYKYCAGNFHNQELVLKVVVFNEV